MTALLRDALLPNLVQTREGGPALVHGGPVRQHRARLQLHPRDAARRSRSATTSSPRPASASTSAARSSSTSSAAPAGIWPRALVLVATLRALKMHGGAPVKTRGRARTPAALERGPRAPREAPRDGARASACTPVVAINVFPNDTDGGARARRDGAAQRAACALARCEGFARGGEGALELARAVAEVADATDAAPPEPRYVYELARPARGEDPEDRARRSTARRTSSSPARREQGPRSASTELGYGELPDLHGEDAALAHRRSRRRRAARATSPITVREVRLSRGRRLPRAAHRRHDDDARPAEGARRARVKLLPDGRIRGLMQND